MSKRFLIALVGLIGVVGSLLAYFLYHRFHDIKLIRNLLSLPKGRRFFWYLLRKNGFNVIDTDVAHNFSLEVNGELRKYRVKIDFLLKRDRARYAGVFAASSDERDLMKSFFIFCYLYDLEGVVFYREDTRTYDLWKF